MSQKSSIFIYKSWKSAVDRFIIQRSILALKNSVKKRGCGQPNGRTRGTGVSGNTTNALKFAGNAQKCPQIQRMPKNAQTYVRGKIREIILGKRDQTRGGVTKNDTTTENTSQSAAIAVSFNTDKPSKNVLKTPKATSSRTRSEIRQVRRE